MVLGSVEYIWLASIACWLRQCGLRAVLYSDGSKMPLEDEYPFYVLIETSGSNADHDQEKLVSPSHAGDLLSSAL